MEYEQAVRYLFSLLGSIRKENFGLERMRRLVAELGRPERGPGIIHIAGTNGKGSTAAMIEAGLNAAGRTTGLYSSPHLTRINERFRINGRVADDEAVGAAIAQVRRANESLVARCGRSAHPTFFESATAAGLCLFRDAGVAYRIVETGLGGRLDAGNVVEPEIAVLTRIAFDHEALLGGSLAQIAAEKAAIVKPGCRAVIGAQDAVARRVLLERSARCGAPAIEASAVWSIRNMRAADGFHSFEAAGAGKRIPFNCPWPEPTKLKTPLRPSLFSTRSASGPQRSPRGWAASTGRGVWSGPRTADRECCWTPRTIRAARAASPIFSRSMPAAAASL